MIETINSHHLAKPIARTGAMASGLQNLMLAIALCFVFFSTQAISGESKARPTISQTQLLSIINAPSSSPYLLLDVRSDDEYKDGHIDSAVNISHSTLADNLNALPEDKSALVVVYCRSGRRAAMGEQILRDNGYTNVWHLEGDIKGWQASDLPLVGKN